MLRKIAFAAGTLLAATLIATPPASAHRFYKAHHGIGPRMARLGHPTRAGHVRLDAGGHRRFGPIARRGVFAHYGRRYRRLAAGGSTPVQPSAGLAPAGGQVGGASYYGGRHRTASGGSVGSATCAHRTLPFGTRVLVTNLANARQAMLTVNDRGPFVRGRIVDVSVGAAAQLGMLHSGTARVRVQVVGGPG